MPYPAQTTGLGVAVAVSLAGTGVVQEKTPVTGTQGISHYNVTLSLSRTIFPSTVAVSASTIDVAGNVVSNGGASGASQLGTAAANYAILAAAGITNTGATLITGGNIGSYPTATETGFTGANFVPPATTDNADAQAGLAAALVTYNALAALTFTSLSGSSANLSTLGNGATAATYLPGNYSAGSSMDIPTSITLDAQGNANAVFIFKAGSTVTLESNASVLLVNGAQAANVYWLVGSSFTSVFGSVSVMQGNILANTSITLGGGVLNGRALAGIVTSSGAVTIATAEAITVPGFAQGTASGMSAVSYNAWPRKVAGVIQNKDGAARNQQDVTVSYPAPTSGPGGVADVVGTGSPVGNPFTVTSYRVGQAWVEFFAPTFGNTEGVGDTHSVDEDFDFPIDKIQAQLLVNVIA
jgi:type VI secretion system secreted protein VgrG